MTAYDDPPAAGVPDLVVALVLDAPEAELQTEEWRQALLAELG